MFGALLNFFKRKQLKKQDDRAVDEQIRQLLYLGHKIYDALINAELKIGSKTLGITPADVSDFKYGDTEYTIRYKVDDRLTAIVRNFCDRDGKYGTAWNRLHSIGFFLDGNRVTDYKYYVTLAEIVLENIEKKVSEAQKRNSENLDNYLQQNRVKSDKLFRELGYL